MKVLFLDIDGVLNSHVTRATYGNEYIDPNILYNLNCAIVDTDCKVVISSSWKAFLPLELVIKILTNAGLEEDTIIGATPNLSYEFYNRGDEIQQWLDNHKVDSFAILDDDCDMSENLSKYLVRTDPHKGMSHADSYAIRHILRNFNNLIFIEDINHFYVDTMYKLTNVCCESCYVSNTFTLRNINSRTRFLLYLSFHCYNCSYVQPILLKSKEKIHSDFIKIKTIDI